LTNGNPFCTKEDPIGALLGAEAQQFVAIGLASPATVIVRRALRVVAMRLLGQDFRPSAAGLDLPQPPKTGDMAHILLRLSGRRLVFAQLPDDLPGTVSLAFHREACPEPKARLRIS